MSIEEQLTIVLANSRFLKSSMGHVSILLRDTHGDKVLKFSDVTCMLVMSLFMVIYAKFS